MPEGTKVRIIVRDDDTFGQKTGDPPAPEDAPAPRSFKGKGKTGSYDNSQFARGKGDKGDRPSGGKGKGKDGKGKGKGRDATPPWQGRQALPAPTSWSKPTASTRPGSSAGPASTRRPLRSPEPKRYTSEPKRYSHSSGETKERPWSESTSSRTSATPYTAFGSRGNSSARPAPATKRSWDATGEDSAKRTRTEKGGKGKGKGAKVADKLQSPWEEHWSDEYNMNYYWNSKTGDAKWEKPTR